MEWTADLRRFQAEIKKLQNTDCKARPCAVKVIDRDGIGSSLMRVFLEVQDVWAAGMRVLYVDVDKGGADKQSSAEGDPDAGKFWPWTASDSSLQCKTLFGCYLQVVSACNGLSTELQLSAVEEDAGGYVLDEQTTPSEWRYHITAQYKEVLAATPTPKVHCVNMELFHARQKQRRQKGLRVISTRDHWFYRKWGIIRHETAIVDLLFRFTPAFQEVIDKELKRMGLGSSSTANDCLAVHVRHGDACFTGNRICVKFEEYLGLAQQMRQRYDLSKVYVLTDDPRIAKNLAAGKYQAASAGLTVVMQAMDRSKVRDV